MPSRNADNRFPIPKRLSSHGPARIIALCNQKGGVGKTTTTINTAAALAEYGRKVLLVDFDPQGALSRGLGVANEDVKTIYDLMLDRKLKAEDVIVHTEVPGLDLIPANIQLSAAEIQLVAEPGREKILAGVLRPVLGDYDVIMIDCQPSLGLLTVNALTAAHGVMIPVACDYFALRGLELLIQNTVELVQERLNENLKIDGILATMFDPRTLHSREMLNKLNEDYGDKVFRSVIKLTVKFKDSSAQGRPVTQYAPTSEAAELYRAVAREMVDRGCAP
ncbi:MAG: ParA family protein [Micrococcales bacterium]|jgi:chromosome partitioning protein|nr:ParA family protein [Microbacteriaceae bacterium]NBR25275.1 ParA family protein [Micrococcales bacterium]